jgi:hypothetical protein
MIEYLFKPSRKGRGRRGKLSVWHGAYSLAGKGAERRLSLHTPDEAVGRGFRKTFRRFLKNGGSPGA